MSLDKLSVELAVAAELAGKIWELSIWEAGLRVRSYKRGDFIALTKLIANYWLEKQVESYTRHWGEKSETSRLIVPKFRNVLESLISEAENDPKVIDTWERVRKKFEFW